MAPEKAKTARHTLNVRPGDVVLRGRPIVLHTTGALSPEGVRGVTVIGQRPDVSHSEDGKSVVVDTSALPTGPHTLEIGEVWVARTGARVPQQQVPFVVVDSAAPVPESVAVLHATRLSFGDLDTERLPMEGKAKGSYVDAFKAEDPRTGKPLDLAYDQDGRKVDLAREMTRLGKRRVATYGSVHPQLFERLAHTPSDERVEVAIWLAVEPEPLPDKPTKGFVKRRSLEEVDKLERWRELGSKLADSRDRYGMEVRRVDPSAPVVYATIAAEAIPKLAARRDVAMVFAHDTEGILDLSNSIAIANSDDAHTAGFTGRGVNVAVYEDGPDVTTNLAITDQFLANPSTDAHSRHTHGIIKNIQANQPHGHAPDCNLHSANSMDLDAIRWAAQDRGCTVISQSFHRGPEQTSSTLSFDDIYKDNLALHWPYPTICEAAGNGTSTEFVNHKGFNRLTVGSHNDSANAMASDSCFRNPSSSHGDRELPEISANGTGVTTVGLTFGGTSMAAPAVAGATACVQQASPTLKSWPEGCRAIMMAAAWRNPAGSTWRADRTAGVDAADGAGGLDTNAAVQIARNRQSRNNAGSSRGYDVGTIRSSELDSAGFATYVYRIAVPRFTLSPHVKVALAWDSHISSFDIFGIPILLSSSLSVDLDLHVRNSSGATVASSASWDNSYEIAEFDASRGETYEIRIRRWSGTEDVWFGVAWTTTGFDIFSDRIHLTERLQLASL